jgi:GTP-dependent phosphoenolpyruvate carboxykinase
LLGGGSKATIHSLNNKTKRYIHIPQYTAGDSAHTALQNNKVVEQIVEPIGGGVESPEGLDVGALWFGKRLAETNCDAFSACSSRAGITVTASRMSPEATVELCGMMLW